MIQRRVMEMYKFRIELLASVSSFPGCHMTSVFYTKLA